jgi:tRNA pseudouridine38-40 synthase
MARYFLELAYKGTRYSGFQVQQNAVTVQSEVEKAFALLERRPVVLTGSSRTDSGVHALQNFFHFDDELPLNPHFVYKMNAILPRDIVVRKLYPMPPGAHSRFDAIGRGYRYQVHRFKNPFLEGASYFFPYQLDGEAMQQAAALVLGEHDFTAFCKTNTQVKNFVCTVTESFWVQEGEEWHYQVEANRFLRGMVRLLTGVFLKVGRGKVGLEEVEKLVNGEGKAGFSVPAHGLFLRGVRFPENYFP